VQVRIRRAFLASGTEVLSSTQIYDWAHSRRRQSRRKKLPFGVYWRTLKTRLDKIVAVYDLARQQCDLTVLRELASIAQQVEQNLP
jgi:hypothetical protein